MTAHIQPPAGVDEVHGKVSFGVDGLAQDGTEHIVVTAGLEHQSLTIGIVVLLQIVLTLQNGVAFAFGETGINNTAELALGVSIDSLEASFKTLGVQDGLGIKSLHMKRTAFFNIDGRSAQSCLV